MDVKNTDVRKERKFFQPELILSRITERITPEMLAHPICFIISFLLSKSMLLESLAPFGLSAVGALGVSRGSVFGLIGACLGCITISDSVNSLKYIACMILIYATHFIFSGTAVSKSRVFSAMAIIIPTLCINFVFLASSSFPIFDTTLVLFEITLATACAFLFGFFKDKRTRSSSLFPLALLSLAVILILPLCRMSFIGLVSPGILLIFLLILHVSFAGDMTSGPVVGIVLGAFVSLTLSAPEFSLLCGVLGITASFFARRGKIFLCLASVPFTLFLAICLNPESSIMRTTELFLATGAFLSTANIFSRHMRKYLISPYTHRDTHIRTYAAEKLSLAAKAFSSLERLTCRKNTFSPPPDEDGIFKAVTGHICKGCSLNEICWHRDFSSTRDAINHGCSAIRKNGVLSAKDFPIHFSSRCLKTEQLVNAVNREIFSLKYKVRFEKELRDSHELIKRQYREAAGIFSSVSSDISDNARFDEKAEIALSSFLASYGILGDTAVYRDSHNHINVHLCGKDLSFFVNEFERLKASVFSIVGTTLSPPDYTRGSSLDDVIMRELPSLRGVFGASVKRRSGSDISGDSGSFFRPIDGHLALLLSDGMGSGKLAATESAINVTLLENLLKAGVSPKSALSTLHSALALRNEHTDAFATLDLMYADMFSGECEFYKLGGAPTYIKRGRHIRKITSSTLPAGISIGGITAPDRTNLTLIPGDFVVMTSDGICDGNDDRRIIEFLSKSDETSPKALSDSLLAFSLSLYGKGDDMTVASVLIEKAL